jgi:ABC-type antimicrobial peptide transport system permease subunit
MVSVACPSRLSTRSALFPRLHRQQGLVLQPSRSTGKAVSFRSSIRKPRQASLTSKWFRARKAHCRQTEFLSATLAQLPKIGPSVRRLTSCSYVINRDLFADTTNTLFDNSIYINLAPGVSADVARAKIEALSSEKGLGKVESRAEFIDAQSSQIDQFFGIIYGLLFLSIIIAIVGIVITLLLSVFERRREIGLLRAVGMTRGQAWESITWESVITSFIGAVTGIVLGIVMGAVLITVLSTNGISTFRLPVGTTIFILIMAFIVGVIAAVYPAWRATRTDIISAIATN